MVITDEALLQKFEQLLSQVGEARFNAALIVLRNKRTKEKQLICDHTWKLSPIAGDGYTCYTCGSWKPEED